MDIQQLTVFSETAATTAEGIEGIFRPLCCELVAAVVASSCLSVFVCGLSTESAAGCDSAGTSEGFLPLVLSDSLFSSPSGCCLQKQTL